MQLKQGKQSKEETQWWSTSAHSKGRHSGGTHQRKAKGGGGGHSGGTLQRKAKEGEGVRHSGGTDQKVTWKQ